MASQKKPRPPVPPKNFMKQRSFSEQERDSGCNVADLERSTFQTPPHTEIRNQPESFPGNRIKKTRAASPLKGKVSQYMPPSREVLSIVNKVSSGTRQALPPDDCIAVLNLPRVEPQTFEEDEAPVFYISSSLPGKSSFRESLNSDTSECGFKYLRQTSNGSLSRSIPNHLEEANLRRYSEEMPGGFNEVIEEFNEYVQSDSSASLHSIRIEPSPQRTLSLSGGKGFSSDPDLTEAEKPRGILRSDPDESESLKPNKGRIMRPSMLLLSKSTNALASLHSEETAENVSPEKAKNVDIEKLNRFFGESRETATALETNIYHLLMSGNRLSEKSSEGDGFRAKKSASTWFLSQKALESLPVRPLDAQVPKSKKTNADKEELSAQRLKDGLTDRGKKIMKSFKRRVIGVTALAEGLSPTEELHITFGIPLEQCVTSTDKIVPLVVEKCVSVIEELGLQVEGIYRLSGNGMAITELQEELDKDPFAINEENDRWTEVHVVSNLLKLFFRKLPDSLITDDLYDLAIFISRIGNREKRLLKLKLLLEKLPRANFETFKLLSHHLHKVASHCDVNKMDAHNLAIMFGPTLIRSPKDQTLVMIKDMNDQTTIVETVIKHCNWLFGGWSGDRCVPSDEVTADASASSTSNLQLLANAESLVAMKLHVQPAENEESQSFFPFQGPHRRSKRKHRRKSGKNGAEGNEQAAIQDADKEIELRRVKIPDLPFKTVSSPLLDAEPFRKTILDMRFKVKRSATERLDAKTLDIRLVSNNFEDAKGTTAELSTKDSGIAAGNESEAKKVNSPTEMAEPPVIEIKKYRAYDADACIKALPQDPSKQPTLLRRYSSKPQLNSYSTGSFKKGSISSLMMSSNQNLTLREKENQRPEHLSLSRPGRSAGFHPDVSELEGYTDDSNGSAYWENGSLSKKTNIVVRGRTGRRYCVLSGTDPSAFLKGTKSTTEASRGQKLVTEHLNKRQCVMTCVVNVRLDVLRKGGSNDIELRRVQHL